LSIEFKNLCVKVPHHKKVTNNFERSPTSLQPTCLVN